MPYITCTQKKSQPKVSIEVCARCHVKNCPDYQAYCQPTLFPSFVPEKTNKSPVKKRKPKPVPLENGPLQLSFIQVSSI